MQNKIILHHECMENKSKLLSTVLTQIGGGKNLTKISNGMDNVIKDVKKELISNLERDYPGLSFKWEQSIKLCSIVNKLKLLFPNEEWNCLFDSSTMKPDGGILYICDINDINRYPILITEVKKQGTNDVVIATKGKKQASGNAIERLGKNVIGLRTWLINESIFPFVCFGYGWDFHKNSSILDRVITICEFGELNKINLYNTEKTNRGSFYFRQAPYTSNEMLEIMYDIAKRSIQYYFSKYEEKNFK